MAWHDFFFIDQDLQDYLDFYIFTVFQTKAQDDRKRRSKAEISNQVMTADNDYLSAILERLRDENEIFEYQ